MSSSVVDLVRYWREEEFGDSEVAWEDLLARSDADPLFMGWAWQRLWWQHHKELLRGTLALAACYSGNRLVGLAPFYLHSAVHKAGIRAPRLEMIGSTFRDGRGVFSEYLDVIADRAHRGEVVAALSGHLLEDRRWGDVVVGNSPATGVAADLVEVHLRGACLVRQTDPIEAHRAALPDDFQVYLRTLNGGTRRKLWSHRSKLISPEVVVAEGEEVRQVFDRIDAFHLERWKAPQYVGAARDFHFALAPRLAARGALRMSTLFSGEKPLAVMYNVRLGTTEYNIQSGFDAAQAVGMSPGYLHFGYSLEHACRDGVRTFDFLGGQGRTRQYKMDFLTTPFPMTTFHAIRAPRLKLLYGLHQLLAGLRRHPMGGPSSSGGH